MRKTILFFILCLLTVSLTAFELKGDPKSYSLEDFCGFDTVGDQVKQGDINAVFCRVEGNHMILRITMDDMSRYQKVRFVDDLYVKSTATLQINILNKLDQLSLLQTSLPLAPLSGETIEKVVWKRTPQSSMFELAIPWTSRTNKQNLLFQISVDNDGITQDAVELSGDRGRSQGNCAFVHHGNQGLTYTEVFYGSFPQDNSGFDEVLQAHEAAAVPGNFHMSGTLMPAAAWHNPEFNTWLTTLAANGTAAMLGSALGQHIMPFVQNNMNNWSVGIESDMVAYRYNYIPHVAWVPERVWLASDTQPNAGVIDWLGDNWVQHGINAVILDDSPHLNGYDNRKIHWVNNGMGITLKVIPINNDFVGKMMYDTNGAKNTIQNTSQYGIAVYGTDWEVAAEMNEHHETSFLDNYENVLTYCHNNYPAVAVWKLDDAINNTDFAGTGANVTPGTYGLLGGNGGYGGSNNSWYIDWAGTASHSDHHSPAWNYGYIWNHTYETLMAAPDNQLSQLGWYTLMINLHETGWHDQGVSGWEHRYSSHMKNALVPAEAARWAAGLNATTTGCSASDIDQDGDEEIILYNQKLFAVFEKAGGRAAWLYTKDEAGNAWSVVGSDMAYWSESDGDYNESSNNHFAALSDVSPNYQHDNYQVDILQASGDNLQVKFSKDTVSKTITLRSNESYMDIEYHNNDWIYVKSGFTPDLLDILWSGKSHLQRIWGDSGSYCGQRNQASGATVAYILGGGGAQHNGTFEGTLVMGDEIKGNQTFRIKLYAGYTSQPYDQFNSKITELDVLAASLTDQVAPQIVNASAKIVGLRKIELTYSEPVNASSAQDISHYQINGLPGYSIQNILLTHGRRVILTLNQDLPSTPAGSIVVTNVMDLNQNAIDPSNNIGTIQPVIKPHLVGTFTSWTPTNHDYELSLNDNGLWVGTFQFDAGEHQYKVIESDSWNGNDWPTDNQTFTLTTAGPMTIIVNGGAITGTKNGDEFVIHNNPVVAGNFQHLFDDTDWNNASSITRMNDSGENGDQLAGDGIYTWFHAFPAGNYEYKIALNQSWGQNTTAQNLSINTDGNHALHFEYNMVDNQVRVVEYTANDDEIEIAPVNVTLAAYPNPFKDRLNLCFNAPKAGAYQYKVYNIKGQIVSGGNIQSVGKNSLVKFGWNGDSPSGVEVATGLYLVRVYQGGKTVATAKCLYLK